MEKHTTQRKRFKQKDFYQGKKWAVPNGSLEFFRYQVIGISKPFDLYSAIFKGNGFNVVFDEIKLINLIKAVNKFIK